MTRENAFWSSSKHFKTGDAFRQPTPSFRHRREAATLSIDWDTAARVCDRCRDATAGGGHDRPGFGGTCQSWDDYGWSRIWLAVAASEVTPRI